LKILYKVKCGVSQCFDEDLIRVIKKAGYGYEPCGKEYKRKTRELKFKTDE